MAIILTRDDHRTIDETLVGLAGDPDEVAVVEWALDSGDPTQLPARTEDTLHLLLESVLKIFGILGPERNDGRYRAAIIRLDGELAKFTTTG